MYKQESGCIPRYKLELCQYTLEMPPHSIAANHNKAGYETHHQRGGLFIEQTSCEITTVLLQLF